MGTPIIQADHINIGRDVVFGNNVTIYAIGGPAESVTIGDHTYIGDDVSIRCPSFSVGDYSKLHRHSLFAGYAAMRIGHNVWFGQGSVFDSTGTLTIDDNVCVGAHSSVWSHMKFGDTLFGCRFNHKKRTRIGKDVWIGDSTVVTPCEIFAQTLVLANSVVTHDLQPNRIYAGNPATDVTTKLGGPPYAPTPVVDRLDKLTELIAAFTAMSSLPGHLVAVADEASFGSECDISYFSACDRTYTKRGTPAEVAFMHWLLPERAKFTPLLTKE